MVDRGLETGELVADAGVEHRRLDAECRGGHPRVFEHSVQCPAHGVPSGGAGSSGELAGEPETV